MKSDNQEVKEETFIQTAPQHSDMGCPTLANTYGSTSYSVTAAPRQIRAK